jgi:hypothetical protein
MSEISDARAIGNPTRTRVIRGSDVQKEFATDLHQIGASAHELRTRLEASQR